jgi:TRAP-type C4-dicarboxylate transport system substrate-binding protein
MYKIYGRTALATVLALSTVGAASAQETIRITIASGHPEVFLWVKHMGETFIPTIDAALAEAGGNYEIDWTEAYGGTLMRLGSEVDAMQTGLVDVAMASGVFDPAQMGILNITYAMPFGPSDPEMVTSAVESALMSTDGLLDQLAEETGVVYIGGGVAIDSYNIAANAAIETRADMDGLRIGGAGPNLAWLDSTGAVGVQGSYVTFYNDMSTGVYDGNIGWMTANVPARLYEVAPFWNQVDFGAMYIGGMGVSQDRWNDFPDEVRAAFEEGAAAYAEAFFAEQAARYDAAQATLLENGGTIVVMDADERLAWIGEMANPVTAWREAAVARGEPVDALLEAYRDNLAEAGFTFPRDYLAE